MVGLPAIYSRVKEIISVAVKKNDLCIVDNRDNQEERGIGILFAKIRMKRNHIMKNTL